MSFSCAAILCVRNEENYIRRAICNFIEQGIDVVVIDHESTDGTLSICREYLGKGLLSIENLKWHGVFDLTAQLTFKAEIVANLHHDWIVHADADEWLQSSVEGESLLQGIQRNSDAGFNVINFEEFVFLPLLGQVISRNQYPNEILTYYFFKPLEQRLMRAWNRSANLQNIGSGGHRLSGMNLRIAPDSFVLRHYIVLSQEHAIKKYLSRVHSEKDLAKGWFNNRLNLTAEKLRLPESTQLKKLSEWNNVDLDRSDPKQKHFWGW